MFAKTVINKVLLLAFPLCLFASPIVAQDITADGTTSTEVNSADDRNFDINGGDRAGDNLFHSFDRFSVPNNGSANFLNSNDINNIINRVTGGEISNINGLIKASGSANLFLINPAGIVFGQNARLNIGGSFLSSTADSLLFSDGTEFSANNLQKPLLTINAPIGLNFRDNPSPISNNSVTGLQVKQGNNIAFVGGDLNFDGGKLTAPGGRIELGSLGAAGKVNFNRDLSLSFPDSVTRGNITLSNGAAVNVRAGGGGFIGVNARNLELSGKSELFAGIEENQGSPEAIAGDININATDSVTLIGEQSGYLLPDDKYPKEDLDRVKEERAIEASLGTGIRNNVGLASIRRGQGSDRSNAKGKGGNININTGNLKILNVATINSNLLADGNAGNINISTREISIEGARGSISSSTQGNNFSRTKEKGIGNAGNITINTGSLFVKDRSEIATGVVTEGNAGNVTIKATDNILLDRESSVNTSIGFKATGNAGDINVDTGNLSLEQRSFLLAFSDGQGNSGNVNIKARGDISLSDITKTKEGGSIILTKTLANATGNAGNININANRVLLQDKSFLLSDTEGKGNAGNITANVSDRIALDGNSFMLTQVQPKAIGQGGEIKLAATSISLSNFAKLSSSSRVNSISTPGKVTIDAENVAISSGSVIDALTSNSSEGGSININAKTLKLTGGGKILTATEDKGNAGNININVSELFTLDARNPLFGAPYDEPILKILEPETGLFANSSSIATGDSGSIKISQPKQSILTQGAKISVDSQGQGNGGNLFITSDSLNLDRGGSILASTEFGSGGNLNLKIDDVLRLNNNSSISAKASQNASGGNVNIDARFIIASPNRNSDIVANAEQGRGGNINITTEGIFGLQQRRSTPTNFTNDIDASSDFGLEGSVSIRTPDVNPTQGFVLSQEKVVEPEETVAQACSGSGDLAKENTFSITGRGGFPDSPFKPFTNRQVRISSDRSQTKSNKNTTETQENKRSSVTVLKQTNPPSSDEIIPARGIAINEKGQIVLTRYPTPNTAQRNYNNAIDCNN